MYYYANVKQKKTVTTGIRPNVKPPQTVCLDVDKKFLTSRFFPDTIRK